MSWKQQETLATRNHSLLWSLKKLVFAELGTQAFYSTSDSAAPGKSSFRARIDCSQTRRQIFAEVIIAAIFAHLKTWGEKGINRKKTPSQNIVYTQCIPSFNGRFLGGKQRPQHPESCSIEIFLRNLTNLAFQSFSAFPARLECSGFPCLALKKWLTGRLITETPKSSRKKIYLGVAYTKFFHHVSYIFCRKWEKLNLHQESFQWNQVYRDPVLILKIEIQPVMF